MDPQKTKAAQLEAREMFFEDPSLSINDVAAALDKRHIGLQRDELSRIRQEVRMKVAAGGNDPKSPVLAVSPQMAQRAGPLIRRHGIPHPPPTPMPSVVVKTVRPTEPFNPPHIGPPKAVEVENVASTAIAGQDTEKKEEVVMSKPATKDERFQWLQSWLLDNVETASVGKARTAMLKKFGAGYAFGSQTINIHLKQALEAAGIKPRFSARAGKTLNSRASTLTPERQETSAQTPSKANVMPIRKGPPTMEETVRNLAHLMRAAGVQRVELLDGDNVKVLRTQPQEFTFKAEQL